MPILNLIDLSSDYQIFFDTSFDNMISVAPRLPKEVNVYLTNLDKKLSRPYTTSKEPDLYLNFALMYMRIEPKKRKRPFLPANYIGFIDSIHTAIILWDPKETPTGDILKYWFTYKIEQRIKKGKIPLTVQTLEHETQVARFLFSLTPQPKGLDLIIEDKALPLSHHSQLKSTISEKDRDIINATPELIAIREKGNPFLKPLI